MCFGSSIREGDVMRTIPPERAFDGCALPALALLAVLLFSGCITIAHVDVYVNHTVDVYAVSNTVHGIDLTAGREDMEVINGLIGKYLAP